MREGGPFGKCCVFSSSCNFLSVKAGRLLRTKPHTSTPPPFFIFSLLLITTVPQRTLWRCYTHQLIIMHNADSLCTVNHFFNIQRLINHLPTQTGSPGYTHHNLCMCVYVCVWERETDGERVRERERLWGCVRLRDRKIIE